jgi:hypothetical protein
MFSGAFSTFVLDLERLHDLISILNEILTEHFDARIRFSTWVAERPTAVSWSVKSDDVLEPIAILILKPFDARFDAVKCDVDGAPVSDESCLHGLVEESRDTKKTHGCSRIAFYFGSNLIMYTIQAEPNALNAKAHPRITVSMARGATCRYHLLLWIGNALNQAKTIMLSPLPGYTLEELPIDTLPLSPPPSASPPTPSSPPTARYGAYPSTLAMTRAAST